MTAGIFPEEDENSLYLSRFDAHELMGSVSPHPFSLEDKEWPTVEHYYQAMKFRDEKQQEAIRLSESPEAARKLGGARFKRKRPDWKKNRALYMTRALYTKCQAYPVVKQALLDTDNKKLVENSLYDYFWGCGRDRRGENQYGKVLMNVRNKLQQEAREAKEKHTGAGNI